MARKKKSDSGGGLTGNEWIATYSDTVTLLLTFFILLYSFSSVDAQKFKQVASAFQSVLQGSSGETIYDFNMKNGEVPLVGETVKMGSATGGKENELYDKVKDYVQKNKLNGSVTIKKDAKGIAIELKDSVLFEVGKAEIKTNSIPILEKLNKLILSFPNEIVVEGHTDNVPIKNYKYDSNWELSTARAVNVLRYFVETKRQNPARFTAAGYGEFKPLYPNDTAENKSKNRRVNILIVSMERVTGK
ncbi:flagellar motor protein MotB [Clostridium tetanomorphum]|uniref:OmpA family protein n=1 Tax=Clostridium tetanomorphum TaxID=1553 RepID=A0A923E596_CLOTT|nr:flagellar motor protein MotB [Clostridium tetanomorphum]MBC2396675.1 OmpA family protein [Clostridium tetanomorphum]NRZ98302.1 chemotaxis protein MotB [Clostridium tetanomorphum]